MTVSPLNQLVRTFKNTKKFLTQSRKSVDNFNDMENADKRRPIFRVVFIKKDVPYAKKIINTITEVNNDKINDIFITSSLFANETPNENMWDKGSRATLTIDAKKGDALNTKYDISNYYDGEYGEVYKDEFGEIETDDMVQIFMGYERKSALPLKRLSTNIISNTPYTYNVGSQVNRGRDVIEYCVFIGTVGSIKYYRNNSGEYAFIRCHSLDNKLNYAKITRNFMTMEQRNKEADEQANDRDLEILPYDEKPSTVEDALASIFSAVKTAIETNYPFFHVKLNINDLSREYLEQECRQFTITHQPLWSVIKDFPRRFMFIKDGEYVQMFFRPAWYMEDDGYYMAYELVVRNIKMEKIEAKKFKKLEFRAGTRDFESSLTTLKRINDFTKELEPNVLRMSSFDNLSNVFNNILIVSNQQSYIYPDFSKIYLRHLYWYDQNKRKNVLKDKYNIMELSDSRSINIRSPVESFEPKTRFSEVPIKFVPFKGDNKLREEMKDHLKKHGARTLVINSEFLESYVDTSGDPTQFTEVLNFILEETMKKKKKGEITVLGEPRLNIYETLFDLYNLPTHRYEDLKQAANIKIKNNQYIKNIKEKDIQDSSYQFSSGENLIPVIINHIYNKEEGFRTNVIYHADRNSLAKKYSVLVNAIMRNVQYERYDIPNFEDVDYSFGMYTFEDPTPSSNAEERARDRWIYPLATIIREGRGTVEDTGKQKYKVRFREIGDEVRVGDTRIKGFNLPYDIKPKKLPPKPEYTEEVSDIMEKWRYAKTMPEQTLFQIPRVRPEDLEEILTKYEKTALPEDMEYRVAKSKLGLKPKPKESLQSRDIAKFKEIEAGVSFDQYKREVENETIDMRYKVLEDQLAHLNERGLTKETYWQDLNLQRAKFSFPTAEKSELEAEQFELDERSVQKHEQLARSIATRIGSADPNNEEEVLEQLKSIKPVTLGKQLTKDGTSPFAELKYRGRTLALTTGKTLYHIKTDYGSLTRKLKAYRLGAYTLEDKQEEEEDAES